MSPSKGGAPLLIYNKVCITEEKNCSCSIS
nr:MAG TPA_asm: hypothetical protein [Caudoviricetes sp.]